MKRINREYKILLMMTFFRYLGDCLFYGYLFLFLVSRGLTESSIGTITCITPLVAIMINPLWNHFAKNVNVNRIMMMGITILEGIIIFFYTRCNVFETFLICTIILALIASPFYGLLESYTETFAKIYQKKYGVIRGFGTFGYVIASLIAALLLHLTNDNYEILIYISSILLITTSIWFYFIRPIDLKMIDEKNPTRDYKAVLKNKGFWIFAITDVLMVGVSYAADRYASTYFTSFQGLSSTSWSFIYAGILLTEFMVLIITSRDHKLTPNLAYIVLGLAYLMRSFVFFLNLPLPFLIVCSLLRGLAYGLYLPASIKAMEQICGLKNLTCACFILVIMSNIVYSIILFVSGHLIEAIGYPNYYLVIFLICLLGNVLNIIYQIKIKFKYENITYEKNGL